ncbi:MAG: GPW/gp25 family protein [Candidatus Izemoplasmatales bacterium]|nr:GPW/gp25 family protein [Candidatus Izemoplasmatales bacterium]
MPVQKEHVFSLNEFRESKVLEGKEAIATLLVRIILLQPGTNPDHPEMGVGLVENYRYSQKDNIDNLKREIQSQIQTYLPRLQATNVNVLLNPDNTLTIGIQIDDVIYQFETSELTDNDIRFNDISEQ